MKLYYREIGDKGPVLIIVHGLYGASDNWMSIAKPLSDYFKVYVIDQRNHGQSPHHPSHTYDDMSNDLEEFMDDQKIEKAHLLGHSMGGKTVMRFALQYPEKTDKLIVADIAPKSYASFNNYALETNKHDHLVHAMLKAPIYSFNTRTEIDDYLKKDIPNDQIRQFLIKNIKRSENGDFKWKLNINAIHENLNEILNGFSDLSPDENKYTHPTAFIKGEKSNYLLEEDMFTTRKYFPDAEFLTIPHAGHWLHAEQPDLFIKTVLYFLQN